MKKWFLIIFLLLCSPVYGAVSFDGAGSADDVLSCGASDTFMQENQPLTISTWVLANSMGEANTGAMVTRLTSVGDGITLRINATWAVRFTVGGSTTLVHMCNNNLFTSTRWHNVIVTWDGSTTAANAHIYIDGTECSGYQTTTNGSAPIDNATGILRIGNNNNQSQTWDGNEEETAVWSKVLSASDIAALSGQRAISSKTSVPIKGLPLNLTTLPKVYLPLDGAGPIYPDLSGNGNNCTALNGPVQVGGVVPYPDWGANGQ